MSEPVRTPPFAPFEWLLSGRYLRARRKEGFISVIAGFSFLGIMLGVATLIIVMAVMNGFRKELLDKILGLNGHLLVQPLESPLTDWKDVAERISQVDGIRLAAPVVDGQALASSAFNASGVLVRGRRDSATSRARLLFCIAGRRLRRQFRRRGRRRIRVSRAWRSGGRASSSDVALPISCRCIPATPSRWSRPRAR